MSGPGEPVTHLVEWFNDKGHQQGGIGLLEDGGLVVFCEDDYYNGRVSAADAQRLAAAVLGSVAARGPSRGTAVGAVGGASCPSPCCCC